MCLVYLHINDHVNALALRQQESGRLCFPGNDAGTVFLQNREDPGASLSYHGSTSQLPQVNGSVIANQFEIINAYFSGEKIWR